jgi:hypothetical protein
MKFLSKIAGRTLRHEIGDLAIQNEPQIQNGIG